MSDYTLRANEEPVPFIVRQFPDHAPIQVQVQEFYDRWVLFNETQRQYDQTVLNILYAARNNIALIGDSADLERDQREKAAALPLLKASVLEALERVERVSDEVLRTLPQEQRINLRWALHSLSQLRNREQELAQLQEYHLRQERNHERER